MTLNHPLLWMLYAFALLLEFTYDVSKFIIIHSIVCAILIKDAYQSIDWDKVNTFRNDIGNYFVYATA